MANVVLNDANLTNIANAIREKNGETTQYKPSEMAAAITNLPTGGGGGYVPTDEELTYNLNGANYFPFSNGNNAFVIKEFGDRITLKGMSSGAGMFSKYPYEVFDANMSLINASYFGLREAFYSSRNLKTVTGSITPIDKADGERVIFRNFDRVFNECYNLREINDDFLSPEKFCWNNKETANAYNSIAAFFSYCYSLREVPAFFFKILTDNDENLAPLTPASSACGSLFSNCYALNKIEGFPAFVKMVNGSNITSNMFSSTFYNCFNLSKLTFKTNPDGTPITAYWNNQIIDLTYNVGYAKSASHMTGNNSGLTADGNINIDGTAPTFQAYRTETINDYYATNGGCSKYGHLEAVETINSLPDTSAAGGGNTIKFYGSQGYYTNYLKGRCGDSPMVVGTINKLTEEEIAVATAKGWTVSIS